MEQINNSERQARSYRESAIMHDAFERGRRQGIAECSTSHRGAGGHDLAAASLILGLVSLLAWPAGFAALITAWKATRRGTWLSSTDSAYALAGACLGLLTSALTAGLAAAIITAAVR